jgi:hypothetical protein
VGYEKGMLNFIKLQAIEMKTLTPADNNTINPKFSTVLNLQKILTEKKINILSEILKNSQAIGG